MKKIILMLLSFSAMVCLAFGVFAACDSDEKTVITAELSKTEAIVGEEITLTYSATNDAQVSVTYSKDGGEAQALSGTKFTAETAGTYVFTFSAEGCDDVTKTLTVRNVITATLSKTEAIVGEEVTVTYSAADKSAVTVTVKKDGGTAQPFTGNTFEAEERGVYVFTFSAEGADSVTKTLTVKTETDALFNGGIGTEEQPYEIATAEQFLNLSEMENEILSAETPYFFVLTADIDLSDKTAAGYAGSGKYFVKVFGGTLDGQDHKILCGDAANNVFHYFYNDTIFKNIVVTLGETSVTRLVGSGVYTASGISGANYTTDLESVTLSYQNVDYVGAEGVSYFMGDNNASLYHNQNCTAMSAYYEGVFVDTWVDGTYVKDTTNLLTFNILLNGCDVTADFTGGYGASGAAVFLSGQIGEVTSVTFDTCSYTGTFTGKNVGILFANSAWTKDYLAQVEVKDLTVNGKVYTLGASGITFGNNSTEAEGVTDANKACVVNQPADAKLAVSGAQNGEYAVTAATNADTAYYEIKLSLKTVYWYRDDTYTGDWYAQTNSNNITFRVEASALSSTGIYKAKAISLHEALEDGIVDGEFVCGTQCKEGWSIGYAEKDGVKYLVIDYEKGGRYLKFASVDYVKASVFAFDESGIPLAYADEK